MLSFTLTWICWLELFVSVAAWRHLSAYHLLNIKVNNVLDIEKFCFIIFLSIHDFFKSDIFYLKLNILHFLRQMELQQGRSITLAFTATQYCFKQQQQLRHQIFLQTIFHKLDSKDQILYFSIYARWSCFCSWLELLMLFVYLFDFLKHRGFLSF